MRVEASFPEERSETSTVSPASPKIAKCPSAVMSMADGFLLSWVCAVEYCKSPLETGVPLETSKDSMEPSKKATTRILLFAFMEMMAPPPRPLAGMLPMYCNRQLADLLYV